MKLLFDVFLESREKARTRARSVDILEADKFLSRLIGKKVSSNNTGVTGYIVAMHFESLREARDTMVEIHWDNGARSFLPTLSGEYVTVYGV